MNKTDYLKLLHEEQIRLAKLGTDPYQIPVIACDHVDKTLSQPFDIEYLIAKRDFLAATSPLVYSTIKRV